MEIEFQYNLKNRFKVSKTAFFGNFFFKKILPKFCQKHPKNA